ncbi:MAG: SLC13 family permease [Gammaproteobacteria bacterium]|nr:SLC13 family permease [Gammaproteobacteria bacterium]
MSPDAWLTLSVLAGATAGLLFTRIAPDMLLTAGLVVLLTAGVVSPTEALAGFSNEGMLTVAVMYVIAAGLRESGALHQLVDHVFGHSKSLPGALTRIMLPVMTMSAFVNNTPVVASFIPAVLDWARKHRFSPSKFMIPLSYAAIFGGTCTLIGTSTNLIINGLLLDTPGQRGLGFFELAWVGVPCAVVGFLYVLIFSGRLLPTRLAPLERLKNAREYTVEMRVEADSPLAGKTVEKAGLRHLPGLFLIEIERRGRLIPAVSPQEVLEAEDHLVFAGITDSVIDLQKIRGLTPATNQIFKLDSPRPNRRFIEAVVSPSSPVAGHNVRESRFRSRYGAVVIAVARGGRRIARKIGDIDIEGGDTLLLETDESFAEQQRNSRDFLLLRPISGAAPPNHRRAFVAWAILVGIVVTAAMGWLEILTATLIGAGAMLVTRCLSVNVARNSIDLQVVVVIAAAIGIGKAMESSGAGVVIAHAFLGLAGDHPWMLLAAVYAVTMLLTEMMSNNATAVLMYPIMLASTAQLGLNLIPFAIAVTMAASACFATPIGYQTNLMVMGPGGYRFADYTRFGLPLNLLLGVTTVLIIPFIWPLT